MLDAEKRNSFAAVRQMPSTSSVTRLRRELLQGLGKGNLEKTGLLFDAVPKHGAAEVVVAHHRGLDWSLRLGF